MTPEDKARFFAKVMKTETCWLWSAYINPDGYGYFKLGGNSCRAHRVAYEHMIGPIPEDLQIDHLCRVRHCVNPAHMETVTSQTNTLRGVGTAAAIHASKTHCPQGHEYAGSNLVIDSHGRRRCRKCRQKQGREYQRERRGRI